MGTNVTSISKFQFGSVQFKFKHTVCHSWSFEPSGMKQLTDLHGYILSGLSEVMVGNSLKVIRTL